MLYADDAVLIYFNDNPVVLKSKIQNDLDALAKWMTDNKLTLNANKTKYMIFKSSHARGELNDFTLSIHNDKIQRVASFKYLGIILNENLSWSTYINSIRGKLAGVSGAVRRLGNRIHDSTRISLYYSLCNSYLSYLMPVWSTSATQSELKSLQTAQNNAIRNFFYYEYNTMHMSTDQIRSHFKILNVKQLVKYNAILLMYKIDRKLIKSNHTLNRIASHSYETRNSSQPRLTAFRTNTGKNSVFRACTEQYALLPTALSGVVPTVKFKKQLKTHIINE